MSWYTEYASYYVREFKKYALFVLYVLCVLATNKCPSKFENMMDQENF